MKRSVIVLDDFYVDPDRIRELALAGSFDVAGNYPGMRTEGLYKDGGIKELFEDSLRFKIDDDYWNREPYNGSFQSVTANTPTWVHLDHFNQWGAVVFLTPDPPPNTGLAFYKHKETGVRGWPNEVETEPNSINGSDFDAWECVNKVENKYNRCVLFDASQYHAAEGYMGDSLETSRLFHVFFFNQKVN